MGMVALKCPQCGANVEMDETREFGFCTFCGTKVMQDKVVVEHKGSVKVDSTDELNNLYQVARRSLDNSDTENAARYYDMILVKDPNSWEATFYLVYCQAMNCKIAQISSAANSITNCLKSVLTLVKNCVPESKQYSVVNDIVERCVVITELLLINARNHHNSIDESIRYNHYSELFDREKACREILYYLGDNIEEVFCDNINIQSLSADAWKQEIILAEGVYGDLIERIAKYDLNYSKSYYQNKIKSKEESLKQYKENAKRKPKSKLGLIIGILFAIVGIVLSIGSVINNVIGLISIDDLDIPILIFIGIIFVLCGLLFIKLGKPQSKKKYNNMINEHIDTQEQYIQKYKAELEELDKLYNK